MLATSSPMMSGGRERKLVSSGRDAGQSKGAHITCFKKKNKVEEREDIFMMSYWAVELYNSTKIAS